MYFGGDVFCLIVVVFLIKWLTYKRPIIYLFSITIGYRCQSITLKYMFPDSKFSIVNYQICSIFFIFKRVCFRFVLRRDLSCCMRLEKVEQDMVN